MQRSEITAVAKKSKRQQRVFVWVKDKIGPGYWAREQHELLLIGTKGEIPAPAPGEQFASVQKAPRGRHSEKPFRFREGLKCSRAARELRAAARQPAGISGVMRRVMKRRGSPNARRARSARSSSSEGGFDPSTRTWQTCEHPIETARPSPGPRLCVPVAREA
jgi:hypothetical protein